MCFLKKQHPTEMPPLIFLRMLKTSQDAQDLVYVLERSSYETIDSLIDKVQESKGRVKSMLNM